MSKWYEKKSYWMTSVQLQNRVNELEGFNKSLERMLAETEKYRHTKKFSGQYVLLKEIDGEFFDPVVVTADGCEEALGTENGEHHYCMPIPLPSEFPDL